MLPISACEIDSWVVRDPASRNRVACESCSAIYLSIYLSIYLASYLSRSISACESFLPPAMSASSIDW